jgi:hypothetical protein
MSGQESMEALLKALVAGNYNSAPTPLVQGQPLTREELDELGIDPEQAMARVGRKTRCECGAFKDSGAPRGNPAHARHCP